MALFVTIVVFFAAGTAAWGAPLEVPPTAWSGSGHKIVAAAEFDDGYGLYVFDIEGRGGGFIPFQHRILAMKWASKDGPLCLLARHANGRHYLWLANPSGIIKRLSERPVYVYDTPSANLFDWSPDCRHVVFASDTGGNVDLWRVEIEYGWEKRLTHAKSKDFSPAWSPNGKWITFCSERGGTRGIWILPADAGPARKVTDGPEDEEHPAWSPGSDRICFLAKGRREGIYTVAVLGGGRKPIAIGGRNYAAPVWSSTGKWISFVYGNNAANIFCTPVKKAKGWGPYFQTTFDQGQQVSTGLRVPAWSPARDQLVYATLDEGRLSIRVASLSEDHGAAWRNVYTAPRERLKHKPFKKTGGG